MGMPPFKVLILERRLVWVDAITSSTIAFGDVAALDDKAVHNTMDSTA